MKNKSVDMDMLHGPLTSKLILFALPIALSSMLQQMFNAADTSVVGLFADSNALAAVGTNNEIVALAVSIASGLSVGVNVLLARAIGRDEKEEISPALHTSLVLAVVLGVLFTIIGIIVAKPLLTAIQTPSEVLSDAVMYLQIYMGGYPFLMLYDFGSAILRSRGDSRRPFIALVISGILNVLLNLFFVIVCKIGVAGVAVATDISTAFSAFLVLYWLARSSDEFHLDFRKLTMKAEHVRSILQIGVPSGLQLAVFCFANIFVQSSVNSFGAIETAGNTISINFEYFAYYTVSAFGLTATTFTGQNYAAGNKKRCRAIMWQCLLLGFFSSELLILPLVIWRNFFAGLFSNDTAVIVSAAYRMRMILTLQAICSLYEIPAGSLRGAGYSALPAVITTIGTCCVRIVWIFTVFARYHTQMSLFIIFPINWIITAVAMNVALAVIHPFREKNTSLSCRNQ